MAVRLPNPDDHATIPLYHHATIATGNTQIHLAGQVAWDENGRLVADDLAGLFEEGILVEAEVTAAADRADVRSGARP
jgi:hypothetical protein